MASISTVTALLSLAPATSVSAEPVACTTYQIEGTLQPLAEVEPGGIRQASVFMHFEGAALDGHIVFVTFTDKYELSLGEPALLTTDAEGRASVNVPAGTTNVAFLTESPQNIGCQESLSGEPTVVTATIPVQPATDGPIAGGPVSSGPVVMPPASLPASPIQNLAYTGPWSPAVLWCAVVALAVGIGVGTGRGRRWRVEPPGPNP